LNPDYLFADTRDELRKAIRENIHYGAKVIKIVVSAQPYIYSVDDIKFIIEEAAKAGLKVAADCATRAGSRNAAEAGLASIEHGGGMTDEDYEAAKKNNVTLIINVPPESVWRELGAPIQIRGTFLDFLKRAYKVGVTLAYGTDVVFVSSGQGYGSMAISFIDSYVDAGIPAKDILRMMTTNAARLLGVEKERGAIKPGLAADIIATGESPLDNIRALKQVGFVMKNGNVIKRVK
jgi:imidazolonepropionase-like amidohydrolase